MNGPAVAERRGTKRTAAAAALKKTNYDFSKWSFRPTAKTITYLKNGKTPNKNNANERAAYIEHVMKTKAWQNAKAKLAPRAARRPQAAAAQTGPANAKRPRATGIPYVNRYKVANNGYNRNGNILFTNNPNLNRNNASNKTPTNNNSNEANVGGYGKTRYVEHPLTKNEANKLIRSTQPFAGFTRNSSPQSQRLAYLMIQSLKMLQPSTAQAFSGSKLETVGFDVGGKAAGMHAVYFDTPFTTRNAEGLPIGLGGKIANVRKLYLPPYAAIMNNRPTIILKARFSFGKSIKFREELATPLGRNVWWPIIRAGSANPFYIYERGRKKWASEHPSNITPEYQGNRQPEEGKYYYTPFSELRAPGRGSKGPNMVGASSVVLYKGYTAVEPDVIIHYPEGTKLKEPMTDREYVVGPEGEERDLELKGGPGANHKGVPAETFQLFKAKRSSEMAWEREAARARAAGQPPVLVPKIRMFFIPWFYAKNRFNPVEFQNLWNGKYNARNGHNVATQGIRTHLESRPDAKYWKVHVLKTEEDVSKYTGINARVASIVLDSYRSRNARAIEKLLRHARNYNIATAGTTLAQHNVARQAAQRALPAHAGVVGRVRALGTFGGLNKKWSNMIKAATNSGRPLAKKTAVRGRLMEAVDTLVKRGILTLVPKSANTNNYLPKIRNQGNKNYESTYTSNERQREGLTNASIEEMKQRVLHYLSVKNIPNKRRLVYGNDVHIYFDRYNFIWNPENRAKEYKNYINIFNSSYNDSGAYAALNQNMRNLNAPTRNRKILNAFKLVYGANNGLTKYTAIANRYRAVAMQQQAQARQAQRAQRNNTGGMGLANMGF